MKFGVLILNQGAEGKEEMKDFHNDSEFMGFRRGQIEKVKQSFCKGIYIRKHNYLQSF
jgi:hypothetical protein